MVGTHKKRQVACMFLFFTLCRNVQLVCSHFHHWFVYDILNILFLILTLNATLARERVLLSIHKSKVMAGFGY